MTASKDKNKVFPSNKNVNYYYYLVEVSNDRGEHLCCYIIDQAYTGRDNLAKQSRLYSQVQAQLYENSQRTRLRYSLSSWGSRNVCLAVARNQGWQITG